MRRRVNSRSIGQRKFARRCGPAGSIALVVVLWTVLLLSLITAGFLAAIRTEVRVARNARAFARAEALADGARGIQVPARALVQ